MCLACPPNCGIVWRKARWCWAFLTGTDWDRYRRYFWKRPNTRTRRHDNSRQSVTTLYTHVASLSPSVCLRIRARSQVPGQWPLMYRNVSTNGGRPTVTGLQRHRVHRVTSRSVDRLTPSNDRRHGAISRSTETPFTTLVVRSVVFIYLLSTCILRLWRRPWPKMITLVFIAVYVFIKVYWSTSRQCYINLDNHVL